MSVDYSCVNESEYRSWVPQPRGIRAFAGASETPWILLGHNVTLSILIHFGPNKMSRWLWNRFQLLILKRNDLEERQAGTIGTDNLCEKKVFTKISIYPKQVFLTVAADWMQGIAMSLVKSSWDSDSRRWWQWRGCSPKPLCCLRIPLWASGRVFTVNKVRSCLGALKGNS